MALKNCRIINMLFKPAEFVVIWHGSNRKRITQFSEGLQYVRPCASLWDSVEDETVSSCPYRDHSVPGKDVERPLQSRAGHLGPRT